MRRRLCLLALGLVVTLGSVLPAGLWWAAWPYRHAPRAYLLPVDGLEGRRITSQWHAPRTGGRKHEGLDLFAPKGTVVRAATRGRIWRVGWDSLGGRVVTVLGDGPAFYYYAHLDSWAPGVTPGLRVEAGTPLGTVGNTGNAARTPPHLHFGVYRIGWSTVRATDPAPLLARVGHGAHRLEPRGDE